MKTDDYTVNLLTKVISEPGNVIYFPTDKGLSFMTAVDKPEDFELIKLFFENPDEDGIANNMFELHVYIEDDVLFLHIGDYMINNFTFGLNDVDLIKQSLYIQNKFDFIIVYMGEKLNTAMKSFNFSDRHKEIIKAFVTGDYSKEVNLKDKYGRLSPFETEREAQLSFLGDAIDLKLLKNNENLTEYIKKKYDINNIDKENQNLMNEILDYVLTRFIINPIPLGYCIHDKLEMNNCKKESCADCKGC